MKNTMINRTKIRDIGLRSQFMSNYKYDRISVEYGARQMVDLAKQELKNHEQEILWKFENILGKLVLDHNSFENITNDFKKVLVNEL